MAQNGQPNTYEQKFADFIKLLADAPEDLVVIHHPGVLGDTYEEIIRSLNEMADAEKHLAILPRKERT